MYIMDNCKQCKEVITSYDVIGKTYYILEDDSVLCYRHWHQERRPKYISKGDYNEVFFKYKKHEKY